MDETKPLPMSEGITRSLRALVLKADPFPIAAALLMALAAFYFLQSLVEGLIVPAIAFLFSKPGLYALTFTIDGTEFGYGSVLAGVILLALAFLVVALLAKARQRVDSPSRRYLR